MLKKLRALLLFFVFSTEAARASRVGNLVKQVTIAIFNVQTSGKMSHPEMVTVYDVDGLNEYIRLKSSAVPSFIVVTPIVPGESTPRVTACVRMMLHDRLFTPADFARLRSTDYIGICF